MHGQVPIPISQEEYYTAISDSYRKAEKLSRRIESVENHFSKGTLYRTDLTIWEYVLPDRKRTVSKRTEGGTTQETERIEIGTDVYTRENGGQWQKSVLSGGGGFGTGRPVQLTQALRQTVSLGGVTANLYSIFIVEKQPSRLIFYETKVWLDENGLRLREERASGDLYPKTENIRTFITTEYDSNIKIEAPIP